MDTITVFRGMWATPLHHLVFTYSWDQTVQCYGTDMKLVEALVGRLMCVHENPSMCVKKPALTDVRLNLVDFRLFCTS